MKKSPEDIQSIVKATCEDAINFIESEIAPVREKCQRYYDGEVDIGYEEGTSKVVSTKVRDTVRVIMTNLMRVFLAADKPVEFVPKHPDQVAGAKAATDYLWAEFRRMNGYQVIYQAMHDAVVKKAGFVKVYWDDQEIVDTEKFSNVTDEELALLQDEDGVEVVELESEPLGGIDLAGMIHKVTIERTTTTGKLCAEVLPPEDFFVDSDATSLEDALVYGHQTTMRVSDLVAMGYDFEEVSQLGTVDNGSSERYEREGYTENDLMNKDPAMKEVTVTECFMLIDPDGDGKAERHRFLCAGGGYHILDQEKWSGACVAVFESDPIPHLFFGRGSPELLFSDQDASTSMLRGLLNNIALVNMPRTVVNDEEVNLDDALNNETGAVVRARDVNQIRELITTPIANAVLPAMQYYDNAIEAKAGVNNLSAGLNPDLLQNQTATAVNAVTQAGANQIEAITRHIAEGGMTDMFRIMLELIIENAPEEALMRTDEGEFVPVLPQTWDLDMDIHINVGLGAAGDAEKSMALQALIPLQQQAAGVGDVTGMTPDHIRNSVADILRMSGIYDIDRYWPKPPPPPPPAPPQPNPLVEVEQVKQSARLKEKFMELQARIVEAAAKDDLDRDQMAQDLLVDYAKLLGEYGVKVDIATIQAMQNMAREPVFQTGMQTLVNHN